MSKGYYIRTITYNKVKEQKFLKTMKYYNIRNIKFECSYYIQKLKFECNNECSDTNIEEF